MSKSAQAFRTIREVADWLGVAAHVLRFWESKFPQIKPVKRAGGRRYYRPSDMELIGGIKVLLHDQGYTIRGVQKLIRGGGVEAVAALSPPLGPPEDTVAEVVEAEDAHLLHADAEADQDNAPEPEADDMQAPLPFDPPPAAPEAPVAEAAPAPTPAPSPAADPEPAPALVAGTAGGLAALAALAANAKAPGDAEAQATASKALDELRQLATRMAENSSG